MNYQNPLYNSQNPNNNMNSYNNNFHYNTLFENETENSFNGKKIINKPVSKNIKYKCIQTIDDAHELEITCIIYLKKTNQIASSSLDQTIKIWSLDKDNKTFYLSSTLMGHKNTILFIHEIPSLNLICSCSSDKTLKLWNIKNTKCIQTLIKHEKNVLTCSYKSNEEILIFSGSDDKNLIIWEMNENNFFIVKKILKGHLKSIVSVLYIEKLKYLCSGSDDKTIRIWNEENDFNCIKIIESINCEVDSLKYARNRLMVSCEDGNIYFINMTVLKKIRSVQFSSFAVYDFNVMDKEKYLLIASCDCKGRVWEIGTNERALLLGHKKPLVGIVPLINFNIATGSMDKSIKIWAKC